MQYPNESMPRVNVIKMSQNNLKSIDDLKKPNSEKKIQTLTLFKSSLLYQIKEFFNNSTLHGVRYIAETGRPFGEKLMWFCFTTIGAVAALIIIFSLWEKFQTNPTITGLDTNFHNQRVIFPHVMVCPTQPFDPEKVLAAATKDIGNSEEEGQKFIPFLEKLTTMSYPTMDELHKLSSNLASEWNSFRKPLRSYVFDVAIECKDLFIKCSYKNEEFNCCDRFLPVFLENGFCYSFNARYTDQATYETPNNVINDLYETDKKWALVFHINATSAVYINAYEESPGYDFQSQFVWVDEYIFDVLISMKQTYTTLDARQLSITQRKCIFPDERKLKYYDGDYTFTGCMRECRIDKVIRFCNCVPSFYKSFPSHRYCGIEDLKCLADHSLNVTQIRGCRHCELSCQNTVYEIEKLAGATINENADQKVPLITIEYLTWPIVRYKREVLFGWVDLLVSFGGIAGLFLGFSLLSGVEIIYYFTIRACCMLYKNRGELYRIEYENGLKPLEEYDLSLKPNFRRRSVSTPPKLTNPDSDAIDHPTMVRAGTRFLRSDKLGPKPRGRASWVDNKHTFFKPSFKVGNITPYEMYTKKQFRSTSVESFSYMP